MELFSIRIRRTFQLVSTEIAHAVQKVLTQGKLIVDLARKEAERWEE